MSGAPTESFTVRAAEPADDRAIAALVGRLSPTTLRLRFMGAVSRESATTELQREVHACEPCGESLIATTSDGRLIGHAFAARIGADEAEVAFVVDDPWQHHGVGTALFARLLESLRAEGVHSVWADTLWDNLPLIRLMLGTGLAATEVRRDETVHIALDLQS